MGIYNQCFLEEYLRMATIEKQQNADWDALPNSD